MSETIKKYFLVLDKVGKGFAGDYPYIQAHIDRDGDCMLFKSEKEALDYADENCEGEYMVILWKPIEREEDA